MLPSPRGGCGNSGQAQREECERVCVFETSPQCLLLNLLLKNLLSGISHLSDGALMQCIVLARVRVLYGINVALFMRQ